MLLRYTFAPSKKLLMKVMKFGGTSVGKPERMHQVCELITKSDEPTIVVLSALSGTTNALVNISDSIAAGNRTDAKQKIDALEAHYRNFVAHLLKTEKLSCAWQCGGYRPF